MTILACLNRVNWVDEYCFSLTNFLSAGLRGASQQTINMLLSASNQLEQVEQMVNPGKLSAGL
jgi:hypothetical protein